MRTQWGVKGDCGVVAGEVEGDDVADAWEAPVTSATLPVRVLMSVLQFPFLGAISAGPG